MSLLIVISTFYWRSGRGHAQTDTFTSSGTWNVPAGVSSADFEAWGGGGAGGGTSSNNTGGSGGAGGQYAIKTVTGLVTNNAYTITVSTSTAGTSGGNGSAGGDSQVTDPSSTVILRAKGGAGGIANAQGFAAGSTTNGIGDNVYPGGSSTGGASCSGCYGGGGGGGAGSTGAGGDAGPTTTPGSGTSLNGGNGGSGQTTSAAGGNASNYGGGGGGAYKTTGPSRAGGTGAQGLVTVTYTVVSNSSPAAPTLSTPASSATGVSVTPSFTLSTTDADNDYVQYRLYLYQSDCSTAVGSSPFAQASSQTGWSGQDANGGNAYAGNSSQASSTTAVYTYTGVLTVSTTYCWHAQAIDPGGSNTFSSLSGTRTFTTNSGSTMSSINGGTNIRGGTRFGN